MSDNIITALAKALPEIEGASKDKNNPAFRSKYADLGNVIDAIRPIAKHGLWFRQQPIEHVGGAAVETFYIHTSGEQLSAGVCFIPASKQDAHGFGSALSYARRYSLMAAFGVAPEDDDGNAAARTAPTRQQEAISQPQPKEPAHSKLKSAVRAFVHEMEGCGDWDEWVCFRDTKESQALLNEVQAKLPEWWSGGPSMPGDFVPLSRRIEILEANLANNVAKLARA